jgi:hypothetical protein
VLPGPHSPAHIAESKTSNTNAAVEVGISFPFLRREALADFGLRLAQRYRRQSLAIPELPHIAGPGIDGVKTKESLGWRRADASEGKAAASRRKVRSWLAFPVRPIFIEQKQNKLKRKIRAEIHSPALTRLFNLLNRISVKFYFALQNNNLPRFGLHFFGFARMLNKASGRPRHSWSRVPFLSSLQGVAHGVGEAQAETHEARRA